MFHLADKLPAVVAFSHMFSDRNLLAADKFASRKFQQINV
jgi:hypothetical protein